MHKVVISALILLGVLSVACIPTMNPAQDSPTENVDMPSPAKSGTIRLEVPADADVADIPWLMAVDSLGEQGYAVEAISFSDTAIEVAAMAQGDLDISSVNTQVAWAAIAKGAPLLTYMDRYAITTMAISTIDIQACADLDGKSVAVPSMTSVSGAMFNTYVQQNCPAAEPQILAVSGGSNRMAALLAGEVDASIQDIDDLVRLERDKPGEFHPLIVFAEEFPGLQTSSRVVRREFAEQHPEMIEDVIRAVFASRRRVQDPQVLREAIIRYLELEPDKAQQMADVYSVQGIWDVTGTFSMETVQTILEFLQEFGDVPADLEAGDVADLSYYEAVLSEIGSQ
jgi:ABC-type nitrate/sulfonate/bicarbonate transport system substrate-binding protein